MSGLPLFTACYKHTVFIANNYDFQKERIVHRRMWITALNNRYQFTRV